MSQPDTVELIKQFNNAFLQRDAAALGDFPRALAAMTWPA